MAVNRAGTRLYLGTVGPTLDVYTLDAVTGDVMGAAAPFNTVTGVKGVTINRAQSHVYIVDANGNAINDVTLMANGDPQSVEAMPPTLPMGTNPQNVFAH